MKWRTLASRWWPLPVAVAVLLLQETVGWSRAGQWALEVVQDAGRVAWPVLRVGWPLFLGGLFVFWLYRSGPTVTFMWLSGVPARPLLLGFGIVLVSGILAVVVLLAPSWFVPEDPVLNLQELYKARNDVRTTLLQALAGVAVLLGAYFTYRQVRNSTKALEHAQEQIKIAHDAQVTDRFIRAIEQFGSENLDIRLGGIYGLERIARDSPEDCATIAEVLCAYVRKRVPWLPPTEKYAADTPIDDLPTLQDRAPDIQAILTVLGRGEFSDSSSAKVDLNRTDLRKVDLTDADLVSANLLKANLDGAILVGADLRGAELEDASIRSARLEKANFSWTNLFSADLCNSSIFGTSFYGARMIRADLRNVGQFSQSDDFDLQTIYGMVMDLAEGGFVADLRHAVLYAARLDGADLEEVIVDSMTEGLEGYSWKRSGVEMDSDPDDPDGSEAATEAQDPMPQ